MFSRNHAPSSHNRPSKARKGATIVALAAAATFLSGCSVDTLKKDAKSFVHQAEKAPGAFDTRSTIFVVSAASDGGFVGNTPTPASRTLAGGDVIKGSGSIVTIDSFGTGVLGNLADGYQISGAAQVGNDPDHGRARYLPLLDPKKLANGSAALAPYLRSGEQDVLGSHFDLGSGAPIIDGTAKFQIGVDLGGKQIPMTGVPIGAVVEELSPDKNGEPRYGILEIPDDVFDGSLVQYGNQFKDQ